MKKLPILVATLLSTLFANNLDLEQAKTYIDKNETNLAIAALDRVLMFDENNDEAKFYLGKVFANQNNIKLAKQYFHSIKHPTKEMQAYLDNFYKKYPDRHLKFDIYLQVGASVDSNIDNTSDNSSWNINVNNTPTTIYNNTQKQPALSVYEIVSITPIYDYKKTNIINQFTIYNKNVINNSDKDIQVFEYSPAITHKYKQFNFKHFFTYDYIRYANQDFEHRFKIGENLKFNFLKDHTSISTLAFTYHKDVPNNPNNQNYYEISFDTKVIKHLLNNKLNIGINLGIDDTTTTKVDTHNLEYTSFKTGINTNFYLFSRIFDFGIDFDLKKYKNINPYFNDKQTDKKFHYQFSMTKKGFFDYQTKIEYINNLSNLEPYEYSKWIISINLIKQFKGL